VNKNALRITLVIFSLVVLLLISIQVFAGGTARADVELTVFAASSLSDAMDDLADAFEAANPGVAIRRHYASSTQLAAQLVEGAQADVFASANEVQMERVVAANLTAEETVIFATNQLTICIPIDNPGQITTPTDLANPEISLLLAAPDVPIRVYSDGVIEMLGDAQFRGAVYQNLVSEEVNVRQIVAKVALGEVDAGIVYTSDITPDVADRLGQVIIPDEFNITAFYPIARLIESKNASLAQAFIDFALGSDGQAILTQWGFGAAPQTVTN
jgi:molybdate transport system substrate-binding protein